MLGRLRLTTSALVSNEMVRLDGQTCLTDRTCKISAIHQNISFWPRKKWNQTVNFTKSQKFESVKKLKILTFNTKVSAKVIQIFTSICQKCHTQSVKINLNIERFEYRSSWVTKLSWKAWPYPALLYWLWHSHLFNCILNFWCFNVISLAIFVCFETFVIFWPLDVDFADCLDTQ